MASIKNEVLNNLKSVIAGVYESDAAAVSASETFLEMGLDSISIIQVKQLVKNQYNFDVPVDRLFTDISNLDKLADFIAEKIPEKKVSLPNEKVATTVPKQMLRSDDKHEVSVSNTGVIKPGGTGYRRSSEGVLDIKSIINDQLQLMQKQMEILSKAI